MAFKPIDPKRDEFRRYLERTGVIEALTKVFVRLLNQKPDDPLDYVRRNLGDALQEADNVAYLQSELDKAHREIDHLRGLVRKLDPAALEPPEAQPAADAKNVLPKDEPNTSVESNATENEAELGTAAAALVAAELPGTEPAQEKTVAEPINN